ncbi:hypothetical protein N7457_009183 [Penicillium paradoxum]|uniref:uncharacterized protein n=1 Tax=Penicillium paradoxum TaxID=176176 RepID=UPI0025499218|nr:uncharacterized protein N7457_009183 [Penicillium paradoxum]KAJ5774287.1 hypothetical protein N7457_009183 [Penicillium paradoxum]
MDNGWLDGLLHLQDGFAYSVFRPPYGEVSPIKAADVTNGHHGQSGTEKAKADFKDVTPYDMEYGT